ncbi:Serine/threonine-protein kinase meng-po [Gryllus bimaculatus]|nr:Serine/threonine-protein kinase meng-po [Gryllus bimaculatus]
MIPDISYLQFLRCLQWPAVLNQGSSDRSSARRVKDRRAAAPQGPSRARRAGAADRAIEPKRRRACDRTPPLKRTGDAPAPPAAATPSIPDRSLLSPVSVVFLTAASFLDYLFFSFCPAAHWGLQLEGRGSDQRPSLPVAGAEPSRPPASQRASAPASQEGGRGGEMRGGGSGKRGESAIHRVQEVALPALALEREYDVARVLGEGCFARVLLATHRRTGAAVVLKAVHAEVTPLRDFYREFHYSYHLSAHPCVLSVYAVAFRADHCYVFAQEYAPYGDLAGNVKAGGLPEEACKRVAQQLAFALEFLHSKELVHRDLKLENVLVFAPDMSKIKLCDFGETRRDGTLVSKVRCTWQAFQPPEVVEVVQNERYHCRVASDCWQLGIALVVCLTGCPPWQSADVISDPAYCAFSRWQKRRTTKLPPAFSRFARACCACCAPARAQARQARARRRVNKYLKDAWWRRAAAAAVAAPAPRRASRRRRRAARARRGNAHSRSLLSSYGLETTVTEAHLERVWEWVLACEANAEPSLEGI